MAAWIVGFDRSQVPARVREAVVTALVNSVGTGIGGLTVDTAQNAVQYAHSNAAPGPASVIVDGARLAPGMAAFANGVILNALGQEETHAATATHPAETTVPIVLAMAEELGSSGQEVVDALLIGMQVTMGLGAMELMPTIRYEICQAPSVLGTVGAAAGAARLLGLDEPTTTHTLGLAAMFSAGLSESIVKGTGEYHYLKGFVGVHAHTAVQLAAAGAEAATSAFEGPGGFFRMFFGVDPDRLKAFDVAADVVKQASTWSILDLVYKPYPANWFNMPFIDAAKHLREHEGVAADDIVSIDLAVNEFARRSGGLDGPPFTYRCNALASTQFGVATMLATGRVTLRETVERNDPEVLRLCGATTAVASAGMGNGRLVVRTGSGVHEVDLDDEPRDYRLGRREITEQFERIVGEVLGPERATHLLGLLEGIDDLDDIGSITQAWVGA
nr:MmgE/PrpD family protein [Nocardioides agariphilus]